MQVGFAARAILNKLNQRFSDKNYLFAEFYEFDRGMEVNFKRKLAQVPLTQRGKNWVSIMWSRDPAIPGYTNKLFNLRTQMTNSTNTVIAGNLKFCNIMFTYVSNSMSYIENMEKFLEQYVPDGFSTLFDNTPYPEWSARRNILENAIFQPRVFQNKILKCTAPGITGAHEPNWSGHEIGSTVTDGTVAWLVEAPIQLKVRIEDVVVSGLQKFALETDDTLCKFDIGGRMYLPVLYDNIDQEQGLPIPDPQNPGGGSGSGNPYGPGGIIYNQTAPIILYPKTRVGNVADLLDEPTPENIEWVPNAPYPGESSNA